MKIINLCLIMLFTGFSLHASPISDLDTTSVRGLGLGGCLQQ